MCKWNRNLKSPRWTPNGNKKSIKEWKKKEKKPSLKKVINNMPLIFAIYKTVHIDKYFANFIIIKFKNISLF